MCESRQSVFVEVLKMIKPQMVVVAVLVVVVVVVGRLIVEVG